MRFYKLSSGAQGIGFSGLDVLVVLLALLLSSGLCGLLFPCNISNAITKFFQLRFVIGSCMDVGIETIAPYPC
ncbi:MAG: hypothetical protein K2L31_03835, partial [Muribaculum sp.]|nr:hypothetical protein [Muribaculum sp.]